MTKTSATEEYNIFFTGETPEGTLDRHMRPAQIIRDQHGCQFSVAPSIDGFTVGETEILGQRVEVFPRRQKSFEVVFADHQGADDEVATRITASTPDGNVEFALEEWFVRERAEPPVVSVRYDGADTARPAPGVLEELRTADAIVICPANPILSIAPILAVPGIRETVAAHARVVGISNLIAGAAVRGPADRLLADLGIEASCVGVARGYQDLCAAFVIDDRDAARASEVEALGVRAVVTDTLMNDPEVAASLARETLAAVA
jgi:2-phospho-L-lactate transferase